MLQAMCKSSVRMGMMGAVLALSACAERIGEGEHVEPRRVSGPSAAPDASDDGSSEVARGQAGASGALADGGTNQIDGGGPTARTCSPSAERVQPSWRRIEAGLEGFRVEVDRSPPVEPIAEVKATGLAGVAYGHGMFLVVGGGDVGADHIRFATSSDGVDWESANIPSTRGEVGGVSRVFFVRDTFAFVAIHEPRTTSQPVLYTSTDGHTWSERALSSKIPWAFDLATDGERFVLAAGNVWSSSDLQLWTETAFNTGAPLAGIVSAAFGGGRWVASGLRSSVVDGAYHGEALGWGSADGLEWAPITMPGGDHFKLAYGRGLWIASNYLGEYLTSSDGLRFAPAEPTGAWSDARQLDYAIHHAGDRFLRAVIDNEQVPPPEVQIISTRDGVAWEGFGSVPGLPLPEGAMTVEYSVSDIAYGDCRYVVAGTYTVTVPGALDWPPFWGEKGPFLITADLAHP